MTGEKDQAIQSGQADYIRVLWKMPVNPTPKPRLVIWIPYLGGTKEAMIPYLERLADAGFIGLSFDPWRHGERTSESGAEVMESVFGNFRRHMWPILGHTVLDTLRVIDWAVHTLDIAPEIYMGGVSMGGDIAVAVAGIETRVRRVVALVATPDWLRIGMEDLRNPGRELPQGEPDPYAQFFYDHLNPLTHISRYDRPIDIAFICAENDRHVPPAGAIRFRDALELEYSFGAEHIRIDLIPDTGHGDVTQPIFVEKALDWLQNGPSPFPAHSHTPQDL